MLALVSNRICGAKIGPMRSLQDSLENHWDRHRSRYGVSVLVVLFGQLVTIGVLSNVEAVQVLRLSRAEAWDRITVNLAAVAVGAVILLWMMRADLRAVGRHAQDSSPTELSEEARAELLGRLIALPGVASSATASVAVVIVLPVTILGYGFGPGAGFDVRSAVLVGFGSLFAVALSAAVIGASTELLLRPLRAELDITVSRAAWRTLRGRSLPAKIVMATGTIALVLGYLAGTAFLDLDDQVLASCWAVLLTLLVAGVFTGLLGIPLGLNTVSPVRDLIAATDAVTVGDLSVRVPVTTADELGDLVVSFNEMVDGLQEREGLRNRNLELTSDLRHHALQLQASRKRLVTASDEARRQVERDLHDGAQQHLVTMRLKLALALRSLDRADDPRALVAEALTDLEGALRELRNLAHGIFPQILTSQGLVAALRQAVDSSVLPATLEEDVPSRPPADIEAAVYFCCLEAMQNSAKHAGPDASLSVRLAQTDGELVFEVADDGLGFESDWLLDGSSGLQNMADRIGAVGGVLEITSQAGSGTVVSGRIPGHTSSQRPRGLDG